MSEMFYPMDCQSAFCGKIECPNGCPNLPKKKEFDDWKERTKAERPDWIWSPTWWRSTVEP